MRTFWILLKKEWKEFLRNKKFLSLLVLFVFFGLMSPLAGRFMNEIVRFLITDPSLGDIVNLIPKSTYVQSYQQFFKNFSQMGIFIILIVFMGLVSTEKSKGTAVLVLTKGVSRGSFLLAKYANAVIVFISTYLAAIAVFLYYTWVLFGQVFDESTLPSLVFFGLFIMFMIALTLFFSTISRSTGQSALMAILAYFLLQVLGAVPQLKDYLPLTLINFNYPLNNPEQAFVLYSGPMITAVGLSAILIAGSILIFRSQEV